MFDDSSVLYSYNLASILWSLTITLLCGGSNFTIQWHEWSDKPISRKRLLAGQINCNYWSAEKYFAPNLRFHEDCWRKRVEMNHGRLPHPLYRPRIFLLDWVFKSFFFLAADVSPLFRVLITFFLDNLL